MTHCKVLQHCWPHSCEGHYSFVNSGHYSKPNPKPSAVSSIQSIHCGRDRCKGDWWKGEECLHVSDVEGRFGRMRQRMLVSSCRGSICDRIWFVCYDKKSGLLFNWYRTVQQYIRLRSPMPADIPTQPYLVNLPGWLPCFS